MCFVLFVSSQLSDYARSPNHGRVVYAGRATLRWPAGLIMCG